MNFQSHIQYQDSPYNIVHEDSAEYCVLKPVAVISSVDGALDLSSTGMNIEYRDTSYSDYSDTYSTSQSSSIYDCSRSPWDSDSAHIIVDEGNLSPISPDYNRNLCNSGNTPHYQPIDLGPNYSDYNSSRSPWSSDSTHALGAEGGLNISYENTYSSEDSVRSYGYAQSSPEQSEVTLDELDEVLNLQDMSISPLISAPNENRPDFARYNLRQKAKTESNVNASNSNKNNTISSSAEKGIVNIPNSNENSTISSDAEKYKIIKEQNKRRAKKYRMLKQQNLKEVENVIPQLEEKNLILKSEYESLKKKRDTLKKLLPQLQT